jgi:hypothetical protein
MHTHVHAYTKFRLVKTFVLVLACIGRGTFLSVPKIWSLQADVAKGQHKPATALLDDCYSL